MQANARRHVAGDFLSLARYAGTMPRVGSKIRRGGYEGEGKIGLWDLIAGFAPAQTGRAFGGDADDVPLSDPTSTQCRSKATQSAICSATKVSKLPGLPKIAARP